MDRCIDGSSLVDRPFGLCLVGSLGNVNAPVYYVYHGCDDETF